MSLFSRIPENFFSILASPKKELYVEALFVLRKAFKTELVIRRKALTAMLMDSLEDLFDEADFTEEAKAEGETDASELSAKARILFNRMKETGWLETEYETQSFEENVTIPDYAIAIINILYDVSNKKVREYNSYVYATYAALENASQTPDYVYQALQTAYQNTVNLVDELKALFNNIRRYYSRLSGEKDVNALLHEHFDEYKEKVIDTVYFPLKTIDSVPRFKNPIMKILNTWLNDDEIITKITQQGVKRQVFDNGEQGRDEVIRMIQFTVDTYEGIEAIITQIDRKHNEYTHSSVERIRYLMNTDRSAKGKIIELLKASGDPKLMEEMQKKMNAFSVKYASQESVYDRICAPKRQEQKYQKLEIPENDSPQIVHEFIKDVRKQYSNTKIDTYMKRCMKGSKQVATEDIDIQNPEDFILYLLCTVRGTERTSPFTMKFDFEKGNIDCHGYSVPRAVFTQKEREKL